MVNTAREEPEASVRWRKKARWLASSLCRGSGRSRTRATSSCCCTRRWRNWSGATLRLIADIRFEIAEITRTKSDGDHLRRAGPDGTPEVLWLLLLSSLPGLAMFSTAAPPLKRWAIILRPVGRGFTSGRRSRRWTNTPMGSGMSMRSSCRPNVRRSQKGVAVDVSPRHRGRGNLAERPGQRGH